MKVLAALFGGASEDDLGQSIEQLRQKIGYSSGQQFRYFQERLDSIEERVRLIETALIIAEKISPEGK